MIVCRGHLYIQLSCMAAHQHVLIFRVNSYKKVKKYLLSFRLFAAWQVFIHFFVYVDFKEYFKFLADC